jgi:hypothetical protein
VQRQRRPGRQEEALECDDAGALALEEPRHGLAHALVTGLEAVLQQIGVEGSGGAIGGVAQQRGGQQVAPGVAAREVDDAPLVPVLGADGRAHRWSIPSGA